MNFHKTIGFLASLLLVLGLGVPDSFAQDPAIAKSLKLTISRSVVRDTVSVAHQMRINVEVTLDKAALAATTVTVALTDNASDGEYSSAYTSDAAGTTTTTDAVVEFAVGDMKNSVTHYVGITPATGTGGVEGDDDGDDETGTITGTIADPNGDTDTADNIVEMDTFTIQDYSRTFAAQDAVDARGYQVRITKATKSNTGWVKAAKTINVQVLRRNHVGADFGRFSSIVVALRDSSSETDVNANVFAITVENTRELGSLSLATIRSGTQLTATGAVDKVVYTRRSSSGNYDKLEFRFNIPATPATETEKLYAAAIFTSTTGTHTLANTEDKRFLVPDNEAVFPDEKVGDGTLLKLDNAAPAADILGAGNLTVSFGNTNKNKTDVAAPSDATDVSTYQRVKKNQQIVIEADFDAFPEASVRFQVFSTNQVNADGVIASILPADPTNRPTDPALPGNAALTPWKGNFSASDVYSADTLIDSVQVKWANLRRKYPNSNPTGNQDFVKKGDVPDGHVGYDNFPVEVRVTVLDKAGNATPQTVKSPPFVIDFKTPEVTILYPKPSATDSARFTAEMSQNYEFLGDDAETQTLKPLKFRLDEQVRLAWVIIGTDTLEALTEVQAAHTADNDDTADPPGDGGPYEVTLDLTTLDLKNPIAEPIADEKANDPPHEDVSAAGDEVTLKVVVQDMAKNKSTGTPDGQAIFDAKPPTISDLFPNTTALADHGNQIGGVERTQDPVFSLNEKVDSLVVRYDGDRQLTVRKGGSAADALNANENIRIQFVDDDKLIDGETYDLQVYARDLARNVGISDSDPDTEGAQPIRGLRFDEDLDNPDADGFTVVAEVRDNTLPKTDQSADAYAKMDSVVAGQPVRLTITATDSKLDLPAVTYNKDGVIVAVTHSDPDASVFFWGDGVMDEGGGTATLNSAGWAIGTRKIFVVSETVGTLTVAVKDMSAESVLNFDNEEKPEVDVDAADFNKIVLSAWEDGQDATNVWEDFGLRMVPADEFGNPSLKTFFDQTPGTKKADSLNILDTRLKNDGNTAMEYDDGIDIQLQATPPLGGLLSEVWGVGPDGHTLSVTAPNRPGVSLTIQARVRSSSVDDDDERSENNRGSLNLTIQAPLDISITLWVSGMDTDQAGETVTIPAGGEVMVTARAEGLNEGDMVTFNVDGEETEATADADGYAGQSITLTGSGTVSVTATSGQYSASLDIVHEEQAGRREFTDANGDPVYLVDLTDNTVNENDIMAFVGAYLSSAGDANYNPQADADDSGTVDDDDLALIVTSWLKTAENGPATKPIVLPGVNANAEFALNLGSERVIAGELMAVDVSLANVEALMGYGFKLNYDATKFEFVSVAPADEDLLTSTGGEALSHHVVSDGQVSVVTGMYNGTAVSGGGDIVRFVFRVLYEFEDNARFEIADGLVFDPTNLSNPAVVAGVLELQSTPREFALHQNFPNPFNPDTTIKYDLAESADVTLQIYNVLGQVVRTLVASEAQNAGRYQIRWNGMDERGVPVSSGIYFYQIAADGKFSDVRKLMLLK